MAARHPSQPADQVLRRVPDEDLVNASEFALSKVDEYFTRRHHRCRRGEFFHKLGATRAAQGLPLAELVSAVLLFKHEIWISSR